MSYTKTNWQNTPSTQTPISAANLNHMEQGIYDAAQTADSAQSGVDGLDPRMDLVEQRLDNLIPHGTPTQGNAELIDIRVGANGVTYPDAGSAVRGQYTQLNSALNYTDESIYQSDLTTDFDVVIGGIGSSGVNTSNTARCRTGYIPLRGINFSKLLLNTNDYRTVNAFLYDSNKNPISRIYDIDLNFVNVKSDDNATFFRCAFAHIDTEQEITDSDIATITAALKMAMITDESLTKHGVPSDAYAVGQYAKNINHNTVALPTWELGTIGTTTGRDNSSTTRIRTVGYLDFEKIGMISFVDNGFKYAFRCYDSNKNFIEDYNTPFGAEIRLTSAKDRPLAAFFRIIAAKTDDTEILSEEINTVASAVHVICSNADLSLTKYGYYADAGVVGANLDKLKKRIKILSIGNSYTRDTLRWVWKILKECGYDDVIVGHGYIGGITLKEQYDSLQEDAPYHASFQYWKYTDSQNASKTSNQTLDSIINDETWDVIIFQQQSDETGQYTSFVSDSFDINDFVSYILTALPNAKIGIALTWSHATGYTGERFIEYYGGDPAVQLAANKTVIPQVANHMTKCDYIVNYGLAVEEGRNNAYLGALGTEMLRSDKNHLYYGIPSYMCGLVLVKTVTNAEINELTWYPNSTDEGETCVTNPYLAWLGRQCAKIASNKMS